MGLIVDFLVPDRPVSHQAKNKKNKAAWRDVVGAHARSAWSGKPLVDRRLKFTMVFLSGSDHPGDINNFVKPVQDALVDIIYEDDRLVLDVSAHMRVYTEPLSLSGLPDKLADAVLVGFDCVYVAISDSRELAQEMT